MKYLINSEKKIVTQKATKLFRQNVADLKSYVAIGFDDSYCNRDLELGKDFEERYQVLNPLGSWILVSKETYDKYEDDNTKRTVAVAIPAQKEGEYETIEQILYKNSHDTGEGMLIRFENIHKVIELLKQRQQGTDAPWVSVYEGLPKSGENVLCYTGSRMIENSWEAYTDQDQDWFKRVFTHWMPLPSPPTEK